MGRCGRRIQDTGNCKTGKGRQECTKNKTLGGGDKTGGGRCREGGGGGGGKREKKLYRYRIYFDPEVLRRR